MLTIFLLTHIFACIYIKFGLYEISIKKNCWITEKKIDYNEFYSLYINAYYFISVTMITVGYGDFYPVNIIYMYIKNNIYI